MRNRWFAIGIIAGVLLASSWTPSSEAQAPAAGAQAAPQEGRGGGRGGRGGRGRGATTPAASKPTPRWPDGRVNLSQAPGVKGFWNVMSGSPIAPAGLPGNLTLEQVPFQDWARELYAYRQTRGG